MKRNSFLLYTDSLEIISELSDAQAGRLLRAIVLYQKHVHDENNTEYEEFLTDSLVRVCFSQIRASMDRDNEKYREVCRKRADAGRKGGISKRDSHKKESLSPVLSLSDISQSLMGDNLWKEQMCRQSGIGAGNFLKIIGEQIRKFLTTLPLPVRSSLFSQWMMQKGGSSGGGRIREWRNTMEETNHLTGSQIYNLVNRMKKIFRTLLNTT